MLNEYEIVRFPKTNIFLAFVKLVLLALVLHLCILYIPELVGLAKETSNSEQESDFRIRVIANSNTAADQLEKEQLVDDLKPYFLQVANVQAVDNEQLKLLEQKIDAKIKENYPQLYTQVTIGDNLFPPKRQNANFYPQNVYRSIVVKIGDGRGDNWWCSIFPSVCEPEKEKEEEKEEPVTFFIWEWIKGFFD
ncbi:stage II sporulation protein R [Lysinibacillus sp. NPDC096418]|uniref:stage II sporulation protein R n=1 Tax=Lysinibacillus sp. NPDC096418 TaxID=3364138 RepID=UPI00382DE0C1